MSGLISLEIDNTSISPDGLGSLSPMIHMVQLSCLGTTISELDRKEFLLKAHRERVSRGIPEWYLNDEYDASTDDRVLYEKQWLEWEDELKE